MSEWLSDDPAAEAARAEHRAAPNGHGNAPRAIPIDILGIQSWLTRDIAEPDFMLGELVSTTSRIRTDRPDRPRQNQPLAGRRPRHCRRRRFPALARRRQASSRALHRW